MHRGTKRDLADAETEPLGGPESHDERAAEARERQQAAAFLRAARLTDDAGEREALRRKAGELLSARSRRPRRRAY